jgi:hypothetical protein
MKLVWKMSNQVDLVINCFERTYRDVLLPGFFPEIERQNGRRFTGRIVLINNVDDRDHARNLASELKNKGEIDSFYWVAERLDAALQHVRLRRQDLGRLPHHTDCAIVMQTLPGSPWVLYWDAEIRMVRPGNWVDAAVEFMESDSRILVSNPSWSAVMPEREIVETKGDFALGYGFSDQVFLARRNELTSSQYGLRCLASLRYPTAHIAPIFEERLDAYMRAHRRLRATHLISRYTHPDPVGVRYPPRTIMERVRLVRNRFVVAALKQLKLSDPTLRV